jgi:hypothetical protein
MAMDLRLISLGVLVGGLVVSGVARRRGAWRAKDWASFAFHMLIAAALIALALFMATEVDRGLTRGWGPGARAIYVFSMLAMVLCGVVIGAQSLRAFAGDTYEPRLYRGYLLGTGTVAAALCVAAWLSEVRHVSFDHLAEMVGGLFAIWLGLWTPDWFEAHGGVQFLESALGRVGIRLLYIAIGVVLLIVGIAGI